MEWRCILKPQEQDGDPCGPPMDRRENKINSKEDEMRVVNQRDPSTDPRGDIVQTDVDLLMPWTMKVQKRKRVSNVAKGTEKKAESLMLLRDKLLHRQYLDGSIDIIGLLLFGPMGPYFAKSPRGHGLPVADDVDCLQSMIRLFVVYCAPLTHYGLKHYQALANICNAGLFQPEMEEACKTACGGQNFGKWNPLTRGYNV